MFSTFPSLEGLFAGLLILWQINVDCVSNENDYQLTTRLPAYNIFLLGQQYLAASEERTSASIYGVMKCRR